MTVQVILMVILGVAVVIGAVAGLVKGYSKTSFWGGTVLFTLLLTRLIGGAVKKGSNSYVIAVLVAAVASLVLFSVLFASVRSGVNRGVRNRMTRSGYENYDDVEENEALILNAVDGKDKKQYKALRKRSKKLNKRKRGFWGVIDRIFGLISGAINGLFGAGVTILFVVLFADFSGLEFLANAFESVLTWNAWINFFGKIALDVLLISLLSLTIRAGYKSGICSMLCTLVILALLILFGFTSWNIANSEAFAGAVDSLSSGLLGGLPGAVADYKPLIAKIIITAILFIFSLVIIIIVAIFLPKLVERFRQSKVFGAVDGLFGAIVLTAFVFALLTAFGGMAYTLNDLPFMEKLNSYMANSHFADCLYTYNPLASVFSNLPLHDWFGGSPANG